MASPLCLITSSYFYQAWSTTRFRVMKYGLFLPYAVFPRRLVSARILLVLYSSQDLNSSVGHSICAGRTKETCLSFGQRYF